MQVDEQRVVGHRVDTAQQRTHGLRGQFRCLRHGQSVGLGAIGQADVIDRRARRKHFHQETRRLRRLGEECVDMRTVELAQAKRDTGRRAAHAARQVDEQRVLRIDLHAGGGQLIGQMQRGGAVAKHQ